MPWKECRKMDEKRRFVDRYLDRKKIPVLWQEFGVSRVTGRKIIDLVSEKRHGGHHGPKSTTLPASQPAPARGREVDGADQAGLA